VLLHLACYPRILLFQIGLNSGNHVFYGGLTVGLCCVLHIGCHGFYHCLYVRSGSSSSNSSICRVDGF
jgi:hypothetical protein